MKENEYFQDKTYLRGQQYKDAGNLDARANLHRLYSTSSLNWQTWVFDQMALQPGMAVLECGCGPGWLWRENLGRIPAHCQMTLTDFSEGMVAEAEAALAGSGHDFRFQTVNIETLPFADDSFDVVVANHMLYHVPDLAAALAEVRRVLRPNGRFFAATNGADHMREVKALGLRFLPETAEMAWPQLSFRLENGRSLLAAVFDTVDMIPYEDSLAVTEVAPLLAYIQSMSLVKTTAVAEKTATTKDIAAAVAHEIEQNGAFHVTKATGLFTAR